MIAERNYKVPAGLTSKKRSDEIFTAPINLIRPCQLKDILIQVDWKIKPKTYFFAIKYYLTKELDDNVTFSHTSSNSITNTEYIKYQLEKDDKVNTDTVVYFVDIDIDSTEKAEFKITIFCQDYTL
jgi:hypothetical protein